MKDQGKFRLCIVFSTVLILFILSHNILQEYLKTEVGGYLKRRVYFEKVISKQGLTLHKGKYWKKID